MALFCVIRWKKEEGRWKREDGRGKKEEGRGKKEEGRRKREDIVLIDVICYAKALVDWEESVTFADRK